MLNFMHFQNKLTHLVFLQNVALESKAKVLIIKITNKYKIVTQVTGFHFYLHFKIKNSKIFRNQITIRVPQQTVQKRIFNF